MAFRSRARRSSVALLVTLSAGCTRSARPTSTAPTGGAWRPHEIAAASRFEAAGVADFDRDGRLDVFSGDSWYEATGGASGAWTRHKVREIPPGSDPHYEEDFGDLPLDVDGDGRTDVVTCAYFSASVAWVQNPADARAPWTEHPIDHPGPSETCRLFDLDGDGDRDLLPNTVEQAVWYELDRGAFRKHVIGPGGHGVGAGDVDGDGRTDVVGPDGWFSPPARADEPWTLHPDFHLGRASIPILVRDVDGDGRADLVWGEAHDYGVRWLAQRVGPAGERRWEPALIDDGFSQAHALAWADLGAGGRVVTGKRVYAHESEPGATDAPVIVAFRFDGGAARFQGETLWRGAPAEGAPANPADRDAQRDFPRGSIGTGLDLVVADLDGDGDEDLVCPGKSGLYWLENPAVAGAR
jgi:hypothetical protein